MDELLTVDEVADILRLTPFSVRRLLKAGKLKGVKPGGTGQWRIRRADLKAYLASPKPAPGEG